MDEREQIQELQRLIRNHLDVEGEYDYSAPWREIIVRGVPVEAEDELVYHFRLSREPRGYSGYDRCAISVDEDGGVRHLLLLRCGSVGTAVVPGTRCG